MRHFQVWVGGSFRLFNLLLFSPSNKQILTKKWKIYDHLCNTLTNSSNHSSALYGCNTLKWELMVHLVLVYTSFSFTHIIKHLTKRGNHITSRITNYFNPAAASSLPTHHLTSDGLPLVKKISTLACLPLPVHCCQGTNNPGSVDYSLISLMQLTRYFKSEFGSVSG